MTDMTPARRGCFLSWRPSAGWTPSASPSSRELVISAGVVFRFGGQHW